MSAEERNEIYNFADWYFSLFSGRLDQSHFREFEDAKFARLCEKFGFEMDCGESMERIYPGTSYDAQVLRDVVGQITDISFIGSAIYSRWRYYTHWAMGGESYTNDEARQWFTVAFRHLLELASFPSFEGSVEKIVLDTEKSCFCPPASGQEIRQRVTIHKNGNVALTRYYSGDFSQVPPMGDTKSMRRYKGKITEKAMNYVAEYFRTFHDEVVVCDARVWDIELTNTDGKKWTYSGSMCEDVKVGGLSLSAIMRKSLEMPELWVFDGFVGDVVIGRKTIDDFTESMEHSPMEYLGETENFKIYKDKLAEREGDTGVPIYAVENVLSNTFTFCGADVSYLIMSCFYGRGASDKDVDDAIVYDILKAETLGHDVDDLLKGISLPESKRCKKCLHSDGDSPYNDGADRVQCMMYHNEYDFKPFEVLFRDADCEYFEEP